MYIIRKMYIIPPPVDGNPSYMLQLVNVDWIEPDSLYVLFIRLKQSASRGELCLASTATSTHTVIITMETYAMDQLAQQHMVETATENDDKREARGQNSLKCCMLQFGEADLKRRMLVYEGMMRWKCVCLSAAGPLEGHSA